MKLTAYRIIKKRYSATAFDGEGAKEHGGRWNTPGRLAVYCAGHVSLAILEVVVHADEALAPYYVVIPVTFGEDLVETLAPERLPSNWRRYPAPASVLMLGDEWLREKRSPILRVPSAVVPAEPIYVLNPLHPKFGKIEIGKAATLKGDPRLPRQRK